MQKAYTTQRETHTHTHTHTHTQRERERERERERDRQTERERERERETERERERASQTHFIDHARQHTASAASHNDPIGSKTLMRGKGKRTDNSPDTHARLRKERGYHSQNQVLTTLYVRPCLSGPTGLVHKQTHSKYSAPGTRGSTAVAGKQAGRQARCRP